MQLREAKVVQLDDELAGLLIPEGVQQDAAGAEGAVRHAAAVAVRQRFQHALADAPVHRLQRHIISALGAWPA